MKHKIIVTGAFGNVGQWVLTELVKQDHDVYALDIKNAKTMKKQSLLSNTLKFKTIWGDLTNKENLEKEIIDLKPDIIVHVAAVIAPTAYVIPKIAYKVNVLGTKYLVEIAEKLDNFHRMVLVSSYSIHGSQNPHKNPAPLTGDSPINPSDNYGRHKAYAEKRLEKSSINWNIVRLPAVYTVDKEFASGDEFVKFGYMLDPNRLESAIDARDAGLAIANAATVEPVKRKFDVCGDPAQGWTGIAKDLLKPLYNAMGLSPSDDNLYRLADPQVDESWYYEGLIDPTESQKILKYQRISLSEHISLKRKQAGISRYLLKIFGPIVKKSLAKKSPYYGKQSSKYSNHFWEDLKDMFKIEESDLPSFQDGFFEGL